MGDRQFWNRWRARRGHDGNVLSLAEEPRLGACGTDGSCGDCPGGRLRVSALSKIEVRGILRFQLALALWIAVIGVRTAAAQTVSSSIDFARARWNEGAKAFEKGDLEGALAGFQAAYRAVP